MAAAGGLGALGVGGLGSVLSGCGSNHHPLARTTSVSGPASGNGLRMPDSLVHPHLPPGTDSLPGRLDHVIVLMMENHSFDNYFGMLGKGDGFALSHGRPTAATADAQGRMVRSFHMPNECQLHSKPSNSWNATHISWDQGRMDGFARSQSGPVSMGYWTGADLPFYYSLAKTFPLADRYFASVMAQTYPNRRFLMAASAYGLISDPLPQPTDPAPPNGTIFDRLDQHGLSWRNYYSSLPTTFLIPSVIKGTGINNVKRIESFFADAAGGTLPSFCIVDPDFGKQSEEDPQYIGAGEAFASKVINAVMSGPAWSKSLLLWCYDEHGGYYDHVPPPPAPVPDSVPPNIHVPPDQPGGYDRYGLRVPAVVVSPHAKPNHVSHDVYDHTSVLKLLESKWNLPAISHRDANANDLTDCLDLHGPPAFIHPPTLAAPGDTPARAACLQTGPGQIPPAGSIT
ncbi:MAG: alkaline phosphatase family protein [Acidimicrobiales bacterium]